METDVMCVRAAAFGLVLAGIVHFCPITFGQELNLAPLDRLAQAEGQIAEDGDGQFEGMSDDVNGPDTTPSTTDTIEPYAPAYAADVPSKKPKNPAATAFKGVFYDNDFSYLDAPNNKTFFPGDGFKQLHVGDCWIVDIGGEYRIRQQQEHDMRGSALNGRSDNFLLQRTRLFVNAKYGNWLRVYAESIDATSSWENVAPRTNEENRFDALNLFADALLYDTGEGNYWGRGGRQELLYGEQRLVSPLDWSNTRRTFDGAKIFYRSKEWDLDGFWTRPVPFNQHIDNDHNFDHPNRDQDFIGLYASYKGRKDHVYDFYYLRLADYGPAGFTANTFGARWKGKNENWLIDVEGGYQCGEFLTETQSAGFATAGLGYEWAERPWKPVLWCYYDYASGDADPGDGTHGTFNQLFPLSHKYFGFMDLVARQNIHDLNFLTTCKPTDKWNLLLWYHIFHLDQSRDALYNAGGVPIRIDPTGNAGTYVGQELDLTAQYVINARMDVLFGYSHFYAGSFVKNTNPPGVTGDADFYYTQYSCRF